MIGGGFVLSSRSIQIFSSKLPVRISRNRFFHAEFAFRCYVNSVIFQFSSAERMSIGIKFLCWTN